MAQGFNTKGLYTLFSRIVSMVSFCLKTRAPQWSRLDATIQRAITRMNLII